MAQPHANIDESLWRRFMIEKVRRGLTVSQALTEAIRAWLGLAAKK